MWDNTHALCIPLFHIPCPCYVFWAIKIWTNLNFLLVSTFLAIPVHVFLSLCTKMRTEAQLYLQREAAFPQMTTKSHSDSQQNFLLQDTGNGALVKTWRFWELIVNYLAVTTQHSVNGANRRGNTPHVSGSLWMISSNTVYSTSVNNVLINRNLY